MNITMVTLERLYRKPLAYIIVGWITIFLPLILFTYFPSQDGPAHINSAAALQRLAAHDSYFESFFRVTPAGMTNWVTGALYGLLIDWVGAEHTDMAAAMLYMLFALAVIHGCCRYLLKIPTVNGLLFYPLLYTHMLHMGSYNLSLGFYGFLIVAAICYAYLKQRRTVLLWLLAVVLVLTYMLHIQAAMMALIIVGVCGLWAGLNEKNRKTKHHMATEIIKVAAACLPTVVLIIVFLLQNTSQLPTDPIHAGLFRKLTHIFFLSGVANYSVFGLATAALLFLSGLTLLIILIRRRIKKYKPASHDFFLISALCLAVLFLVMPNGIGDVYNIEERIMIPWLLVLVSWLAIESSKVTYSKYIPLFVLFLLGFQTIDRLCAFREINHRLNEFSFINNCIPEKSAFISFDLDHVAQTPLLRNLKDPLALTARFNSFMHFPGTVFASREIINTVNYEALSVRPYFPLKYQPWLNDIVGEWDVDLMARYEKETKNFTKFIIKIKGGKQPIDYLLTSAFMDQTENTETIKALKIVIDKNYVPFCISPTRAVHVYVGRK